MNVLIKAIEAKTTALADQASELTKALESFGWEDDRPARMESGWVTEDESIDDIVGTPERAAIPLDFVRHYNQWYSACLALIEANMPTRHNEFAAAHNEVSEILKHEYMTFNTQVTIAAKIERMSAMIGSIPHYMEGRLHDIELEVAQAYVGDQLSEAALLLKAGHIRAAGAIAGVLLERHLKLLCDRHQPPLKYAKTAGIAKLNDLLKNSGVYDIPQWRKTQWMGDVRNACDHSHTSEPSKSDVIDLIAEVRKFVALFVI